MCTHTHEGTPGMPLIHICACIQQIYTNVRIVYIKLSMVFPHRLVSVDTVGAR